MYDLKYKYKKVVSSFVGFFLFAFFLTPLYAQQIEKTPINYVDIPLVFNNWFPAVIVNIQGLKITLKLDLGTANTNLTLNPNLIKKFDIKVHYTGNTRQVSDTQGRTAVIKEFILSKIKIGDLSINNIKCFETHPFPWGTPGKPPQGTQNGVIGLGLLSKFNILIDYKTKKLILIKGDGLPSSYAINSWTKIPFVMNGNIITSIKNRNSRINLLWDTGAPINLIKPTAKLSGKLRKCTVRAVNELGVTAKNCKGIMTTLIMGKQHFKNIIFYVYSLPGLPADGVLGEPFIKNHIIYINFSQRILAISKLKD